MVGNMNLVLVLSLFISLASILVVINGERVLIGEALDEQREREQRPNQFDKFESIDHGGGGLLGQSQQLQPDYVWELKAFKRNRGVVSSGGTYFSPRLGRKRKRSASESTENESSVTTATTTLSPSSPSTSSLRERLALLKLLRRIIKMEGASAGAPTAAAVRGEGGLNPEYQSQKQQKPHVFGTLLHSQDSSEHQRPLPSSFHHFYAPRMDNQLEGEESTPVFAPRALRDHISPRLG